MKVAIDVHTLGQFKTGNETYIKNLCSNFSPCEGSEKFDFNYYYTRPIEEPPWPGHFKKVWPHNPLLRIPFAFPWKLWRDKIKLAHFQYTSPPICPCPTIVTIHDISFERHPEFFSPLATFRMRNTIYASAKRADMVIAISEATRNDLIELYKIPEDKIQVIHHGVDIDYFTQKDLEQDKINLKQLNIHRPYLLCVGNLQSRKNIEQVVFAFNELQRKSPRKLDLVIAGQESYGTGPILNTIKTSPNIKNIHLTGYISDSTLKTLYQNAEMLVFISKYEGFGLPILESMASSTAVICSNVSCMPEIAGKAAQYVDPDNIDDILTAIEKFLDNHVYRNECIKRGLEHIKSFTWKSCSQKTLKLYEKFL